MIKQIITIFILLMIMIGCTVKESENKQRSEAKAEVNVLEMEVETELNYSSLKDTTELLDATKIDSSKINEYKSFVKTNSSDLIGLRQTEIDSLFIEELEKFNEYLSIQDLASIDFEEKSGMHYAPDNMAPIQLQKKIEFFYHLAEITNNTDKIINAIVFHFTVDNIYQERVGRFRYELVDIINPETAITDSISIFNSFFGKSYRQQIPHFVNSRITKIVLSDSTDLESRVNSEIYDFSDYDIPEYFHNSNLSTKHGIFLN